MLGLGLSVTQLAVRGLRLTDLAAAIRSLFAAGEQGVWYDPSDLTTLYQDAAGTTPVTAVEQPVGRILDKSGRGNHATQTTSTSRPVLSARYNLLTKTEQFDEWTKVGVTTPSTTEIRETSTYGQHIVYKQTFDLPSATIIVDAKANGRDWMSISTRRPTGSVTAYFNIATGSLGSIPIGYTASINPLGDGVYRCALVGTMAANGSGFQIGTATANGVSTHFGDTAVGLYIYRASTTSSDQAILPYQRVNTATDYDADPAKFPHYLRFDGVDDFLVTNSINFTATDKMFVSAGVRKLSDASLGCVAGTFSSGSAGGFELLAPRVAPGEKYGFLSSGTIPAVAITSDAAFSAPATNVLTGIGNISGDQAILRANGVQVGSSTDNQGTGNYGNYSLYLGVRPSSAFPFAGHLYQLVVRGAQSTAQQIIDAETYINSKTKAYA